MKTTQKKMYIVLSLTITASFIIQSAQKAIFIWYWEEPYGLLTSVCVGQDGKVLDKDQFESSPYQKDSSITDLLTAVLFSLLIDQFICIFHTIPTTCGVFGQPFSAYEPDEEVKRESMKIL